MAAWERLAWGLLVIGAVVFLAQGNAAVSIVLALIAFLTKVVLTGLLGQSGRSRRHGHPAKPRGTKPDTKPPKSN